MCGWLDALEQSNIGALGKLLDDDELPEGAVRALLSATTDDGELELYV